MRPRLLVHLYRPARTLLLGAAVALAAGRAGTAPASAAVAAAFKEASGLLYQDAHRDFAAEVARSGAGASRAARFGLAVTLFNKQPRTRGNLEESRELLTGLVAERGADDVAVAARYFLGRYHQVHALEPDPAAAAAIYSALHAEYPDHFYGQVALVKWATLTVFDKNATIPLDARIRRVEERGERLQDTLSRRALHLLLADAHLRLGGSMAEAWRHYDAAWRLGIAKRETRADTLVALGSLAADLGRTDDAILAYSAFLREFPKGERTNAVQRRLEALRQTRTWEP